MTQLHSALFTESGCEQNVCVCACACVCVSVCYSKNQPKNTVRPRVLHGISMQLPTKNFKLKSQPQKIIVSNSACVYCKSSPNHFTKRVQMPYPKIHVQQFPQQQFILLVKRGGGAGDWYTIHHQPTCYKKG